MAAHPPSHETGARPGRSGVRRRHWLHRLEGIGALTGLFLLYVLLPARLSVVPDWLFLSVGGPLVIALSVMILVDAPVGREILLYLRWIISTAMTALIIATVGVLTVRLRDGSMAATTLLAGAAIVWVLNVLTFGLWYYYLDGGGPHQRHVAPYHSDDLIFPQRGLDDPHWEGWRPGIIDYLFFAFNTSTAFSPTDTTVLSWRIKLLMMLQSMISLVVIAVLAARAINTLGG
jgi:uncharacterized membrane protein